MSQFADSGVLLYVSYPIHRCPRLNMNKMHDDGIVKIDYIPKYIAMYSFVLYPVTVQNIWMIASKYNYTD